MSDLDEIRKLQAQIGGASQPTQQNDISALQAKLAPQTSAADPAVPEGMFLDPRTGAYTSRELLAAQMEPSTLGATATGARTGLTASYFDELAGNLAQIIPFGGTAEERKKFATEYARAQLEAARRDRPLTTLSGEVAGTLGTAVPFIRGASLVPEAIKRIPDIVKGAATAATSGFLYGTGEAEGDVEQRIEAGKDMAIPAALFGAAAPVVIKGASKTVQGLMKRSSKKPTLENLRQAKNAAYKEVDGAGVSFTDDEVLGLAVKAEERLIKDPGYNPTVDTEVKAAFETIQNQVGGSLKIGQLDKVRQALRDRWQKSNYNPLIYKFIDDIDELIASKGEADELMDAARLANSRYKKAELLDAAMDKAELQTAATGSGGNILNKYRQAVTQILTGRDARYFSEEELAMMRRVVEGDLPQNVLRQIGKLSPTGNGLMTALNLGAVAVEPTMLAVGATGMTAKAIADRTQRRRMDELRELLATGEVGVTQPLVVRGLLDYAPVTAGPLITGE